MPQKYGKNQYQLNKVVKIVIYFFTHVAQNDTFVKYSITKIDDHLFMFKQFEKKELDSFMKRELNK